MKKLSATATPSPAVADVLDRLETWTGTGDADTADFLHDVRAAAALIREQETWILSLLNGDDLAMERERAERAETELAGLFDVVDRLIGFHDRREDAALCAVIEEARAIVAMPKGK